MPVTSFGLCMIFWINVAYLRCLRQSRPRWQLDVTAVTFQFWIALIFLRLGDTLAGPDPSRKSVGLLWYFLDRQTQDPSWAGVGNATSPRHPPISTAAATTTTSRWSHGRSAPTRGSASECGSSAKLSSSWKRHFLGCPRIPNSPNWTLSS